MIITDYNVTGAVKGIVEIALGIKNDHDVLLGHGIAQLGNQLVESIGLTGTDTAQQNHVSA